jgi:PAS domain S-box-containing protein
VIPPVTSIQESLRLDALRELGALDSAPDPLIDEIVRLASEICGTPIALLTLVDAERQWFKSRVVLTVSETPRDIAFCAHAIGERELFVVPDAAQDERFADNPLVTGEPHIRFYAGVPLVTGGGHALGTLCVIDRTPRRLTTAQEQALGTLARVALQTLERGRFQRELIATQEREQQTLARLRQSERRHARLFDENPHAMWVHDLETLRLLAFNEATVNLYGYSRAELAEMTVQDLRTREDVPALLAAVAALRAGQKSERTGEWRHRRKDGTLFWVRKTTHVIDFEGRPAEVVLAHDISGQQQLWNRLQHSQRLENLGLLSAGIAHDFNNILTSILMVSSLLQQSKLSSGDSHLVETLHRSSQRAAGLAQQILAFSRGTADDRSLVQLRHVARDIARLIEETFPRHITFHSNLPFDVWPVHVNATQIHQVILNLCLNARDAMPRGGTMALSVANCTLDAAAAARIPGAWVGDFVRIEVTDTGTGIPHALRAQIWDPFFTTKQNQGGSGLGLSMVRGIVHDHGGLITLDTEVDRGTKFQIYLPATRDHAPSDSESTPAHPTRGGGENILIVDDETTVRELLHATLTRAGYRPTLAADGNEALVHLGREPAGGWRLLITDVQMPHLGGEPLTRFARRSHPDLQILVISGNSPECLAAPSKTPVNELGHAFLSKPFTTTAVLTAVQRILAA